MHTGDRRFTKVSIHAPAKVRLSVVLPLTVLAQFQSTHPQRCDTFTVTPLYEVFVFQSTHPQRCDTKISTLQNPFPVSIHAPAKVRLFVAPFGRHSEIVSIHAPAKVRLKYVAKIHDAFGVSIHAPAKVRHHRPSRMRFVYGFNPRTRKGATSAATTRGADK